MLVVRMCSIIRSLVCLSDWNFIASLMILSIAPPTNESTFRQWTVGPIYYSAMVMAEALGPSNATQVIDLTANGNNIYSPAYAIYEHGTLVRVMLFNYVTDSSGTSDLSVSLNLAGTQVAGSVQVK